MSVCEAFLGSGKGAGHFRLTSLCCLLLQQSLALALMEGTCCLWSLVQCLGPLTLWWKAHFFLQGIFLTPWDQTYGIEPASPALAGDSLPLSYPGYKVNPKYVSSCVFIAHNIPCMTFSTQSSVLCFFCIHVSWRAVHSSVWGSALCI